MTKDFFSNYTFVHTFQWTLSERLTNVTITVKIVYMYTLPKGLNKFDVRGVFRKPHTSKTKFFARTVNG